MHEDLHLDDALCGAARPQCCLSFRTATHCLPSPLRALNLRVDVTSDAAGGQVGSGDSIARRGA